MTKLEDAVLASLMHAASGVIPAPGREPWEYGWAFDDYRRSERAALPGPDGPVCFTAEALASWEAALERLSKEGAVRLRWEDEEVGGLVASLTVAASAHADEERRRFLTSALERFRSAGPAFVTQLISNVSWSGSPVQLGDVVVGAASEALFEAAEEAAAGRSVIKPAERRRWIETQIEPRLKALETPPTAICCWTTAQLAKGIKEAERRLRDVVDLPLMLERDLRRHELFRRGDANRPGVRGVSLDRGAVESGLRRSALSLELVAFPLIHNDVLSGSSPVQWHGTEPMPLGLLYQQPYLREAVERCLSDKPIGRRLRVAARWFSEAHYANGSDDAALALGVCLDALLGGERALPGSAMGDRAALLTRDPSERRATRKSYLEFYGIRSSVAHGGRSGKLNGDALSAAFALANAMAWRLLDFENVFAPESDAQVDELFDDLRMGIVEWQVGD